MLLPPTTEFTSVTGYHQRFRELKIPHFTFIFLNAAVHWFFLNNYLRILLNFPLFKLNWIWTSLIKYFLTNHNMTLSHLAFLWFVWFGYDEIKFWEIWNFIFIIPFPWNHIHHSRNIFKNVYIFQLADNLLKIIRKYMIQWRHFEKLK